MIRRRSTDIDSGITRMSRYPFTAATIARPMPVLPHVGSMITEPGPISPRDSASSTMASAIRSLMLPPGFARSSFIHTSTAGVEQAAESGRAACARWYPVWCRPSWLLLVNVDDAYSFAASGVPAAASCRSDIATLVTIECGGTLCVSQTLPPMTLEWPTTVSPPRIVAFA